MAEKRFKTKIIHKHDTAANWAKSSYVPSKGEVVVYDIDEVCDYERLKLGDGVQNVNALPFLGEDRVVIKTVEWTTADIV